jgi:glutaredoxin
MTATIYSKDDCPWCDKAKALMIANSEEYNEIVIGRDITREEFTEQFPDVKTVPYIIIGSQIIPSYESLEEWILHPVRKSVSKF